MLVLKITLYVLTIAALFFFGGWEARLRNQLTDGFSEHKHFGNWEVPSQLSEQFSRERYLLNLPPQARRKLKVVAGLKFLFFAALVLEVLLLQR